MSRRRKKVCTAAALASLMESVAALLAPSLLQAATIRFKDSVVVEAPVITLGDAADVLGTDQAAIERLERITLGPAPPPGRKQRLDLAAVRSRLQSHGVNLATIEFSGSSEIVVTRPTGRGAEGDSIRSRSPAVSPVQQQRAEKLVATAVREYLRTRDPHAAAKELGVHIQPDHVRLLLAGERTTFQVEGGSEPWQGVQQMVVRFRDAHRKPVAVPIRVSVTERPRILTVKYTVPPGHVLRAADLALRPARDGEAGLTQAEDAVNKEAVRTIRRGEAVLQQNLQSVPLVRANDIVTVYSRRPGLVVKRQMKSRGEAAMDETVALVTLDGRKRVTARVTGFHEAEIIGGPASRNVLEDRTGRIEFLLQPPNRRDSVRTAAGTQ